MILHIKKNKNSFNIDMFEDALMDISKTNNSSIIIDLVEIMEDDFDYPEIMYSIIHVIEKFDDLIYCKEILNSLPNFIIKSPEWASIIFMRIMNSEDTLACFIEVFKRDANVSQREIQHCLRIIMYVAILYFINF